MNLIIRLKLLKRKNIIVTLILVVVVILIGNAIFIKITDYVDSKEEERLFQKYSNDPQLKRFTDMIEADRKTLADKNMKKEDKFTATMDMGFEWYNLREFKFAVRWWEKGLDIQSDNFIGWYNLGNAYRELKKYSKAESAYRYGEKIADAGETDACLSLGEMYKYLYTSKKDQEGDVYLKCLNKHRDNRDLIARLAIYYRDSGDTKNAIIYFDKLFSIDPSSAADAGEEIKKLQAIEQSLGQ